MAALLCCAASTNTFADISVRDDSGRPVSLDQAAQRIISLAPHTTELLFAAGAGDKLVAVSEYSDYPEQARKIASIGNVFAPDLERIVALRPDLVLIWSTGKASALAEQLRALHLKVFESDPHDYETIATSLERLSALAGSAKAGQAAAQAFRHRLQALRQSYRQPPGNKPVRVFYQIWGKPLMTLNDAHFASAALRLCGGENVFGKLSDISPTVNLEAVLKADPEAIISTDGEKQDALADWQRFPGITAVKHANLFNIKGDLINRAGPRILDGTEAVCQLLDLARKKR